MANLLEKYANLAIKVGLNVRPGQSVYINCPTECYLFGRELVKAAYQNQAGHVYVNYIDAEVTKSTYIYETTDSLTYIPEWKKAYMEEIVKTDACVISVSSQNPGIMKDVNPEKIVAANQAASKAFSSYSEHVMSSRTQWCVVAYPNNEWAKKVFPNLPVEEAFNKLLNAIYQASHIKEENDPVIEWENHLAKLSNYYQKLNEYDFDYLEFKNNLGTNLKVHLVNNHIWAGGSEKSEKGTWFVPNIPTEEVFTMPSRSKVEGVVKSTKPLIYNGNIIDEFSLEFKEGKVVSFDAKTGYESLKSLLDFDGGSRHIGEVALISHQSPISQMNILFYNTLFDENASCHLALGNAYSMNIKDGTRMSEEELRQNDVNISHQHVDFMFGSEDMEVIGTKKDGSKVVIFKKGNFVF